MCSSDLVGLFVFCLLILGTRKRVKVFFYAHLVLCEIFFKLISYIFSDYPFISSYVNNVIIDAIDTITETNFLILFMILPLFVYY